MRELTLIRHGITTWNQRRVLQGHIDVPLSPLGRWQALQLAERMGREPLPDVVYSSDLTRARETAEHLTTVRPYPLQVTPVLRERCFGEYEGHPWEVVQAAMEEARRARGVHSDDFQPDGGESRRQVVARVRGFLETLERDHPDGRVWLVSHGGIIRLLLHELLGAAHAPANGYSVFNTSVSCLRRNQSRWQAVRLNCARHLDGRQPPPDLHTEVSVITEI